MNAQKLAITIGLLKDRKCECGITHKHQCMPKMGMPIVEIDGVKNINCHIEFYQNKNGIGFEVTADFKYDGEESENPRLYWKNKYNVDGINKDDILAFSCELLEELPELRLGLNGQLLIRDTEYVSMRAAFEDVFTAIECDTVKVDKTAVCCVCYEKTDTKTPCNHPLCNRCWSKIKIGGEDHNECSCPLCRENIYYTS
jgi:hypothetical protein